MPDTTKGVPLPKCQCTSGTSMSSGIEGEVICLSHSASRCAESSSSFVLVLSPLSSLTSTEKAFSSS